MISKSLRKKVRWGELLASIALGGLIVWLVRDHVFFWDTIQLASKQADWFYQNDFSYLLLPERIDSGHPPGFGMYLATWWTLFGRTLWISHLAMWPWLTLFFYQLFRLSEALLPAHHRWLTLFVLANAAWWGQAVLVSPDVALAALFLLGIRAVTAWRPGVLALVVIALAALSMRAMFVAVGLYLWRGYELWHRATGDRSAYFQSLLPFLPGGLLGFAFLLYHYLETGWIGYHADSPWAPAFAGVDGPALLRNVIVLAWRLADHGQLFAWIAVAYVVWRHPESRRDKQLLRWAFLIGALLFLLGVPVLSHRGLMNHRYFLPIYLSLDLLAGYLLLRYASATAYWLGFAGLLSGNLWLYPPTLTQGWDATPAHIPYYQVRKELLEQLDDRGIAPDSVGTAFPERGPFDDRDLSGDPRGFHPYRIGSDRYIFLADVMNNVAEDLPEIRRRYRAIATARSAWITGTIYERRD